MVILSLFFLVSCKGQDNMFLDDFNKVNAFPKSSKEIDFNKFNKKVSPKLLNTLFLIDVNDIQDNTYYRNSVYSYGFKYELSEGYSLISIIRSYNSAFGLNHVLFDAKDIYLFVYDIEKAKVISRLVLQQSDPVFSRFEYEVGIFKIHTNYRVFKYDEHTDSVKENNLTEYNEYLISKDFLFVKRESK